MNGLLSKLHVFLKDVPEQMLRSTFSALGVRLTINYEGATVGRRRNVPVGGVLEFGVNGQVDVAAAMGEGAKPSQQNRRVTAGAEKGTVGAKKKHARRRGNAPAGASTALLGVRNRGDWI